MNYTLRSFESQSFGQHKPF